MPARDPDVSDKLRFSFFEGNELNLLIFNQASGELQLSRNLKNNRPLEASMKIRVSGEKPQTPTKHARSFNSIQLYLSQ